MSSIPFICNLALANVGKPNQIEDIDEPTAEARACKQYYDLCRKALLESHHWIFARKTQQLAANVSNSYAGVFTYSYAKPSDLLNLRRIVPEPGWPDDMPVEPHGIAGNEYFSDYSPAYGEYTFDLTDPSRFSANFNIAFGWSLAGAIAMAMTRDPNVRDKCLLAAANAKMMAAGNDGNQLLPNNRWTSSFELARS